MRRAICAGALVVLGMACSGDSISMPSETSSPSSTTQPISPSESPSSAQVEPVGVPDGTPSSFEEDVESSEVPPEALVPSGTAVTDVWYAETTAGPSILVAYVEPGTDPFRREHGLVVWRRFPGEPEPWRPVFGILDPSRRGVVQIQAIIGEATADGSPDALTFENRGGSGVCGTWRVLDLAANVAVFKRKTCDTTIDLSSDPIGLTVREAVFEEGDAHCCPSATRISVLTFDGPGGWTAVSMTEQPT